MTSETATPSEVARSLENSGSTNNREKREAEDAGQGKGENNGTSTKKQRSFPLIQASHPESDKKKWFREDLQVNQVLIEMFRTEKVEDPQGNEHKFIDGIDPIEGKHLYNIVKDNGYKHTLEIGLAQGTSALYICQALHDNNGPGSKHVAIDPNQDTQYKSIGTRGIQRANLTEYFELIQQPSYVALPQLLQEQRAGTRPKFQMIFIDGWHTFDYTLVDFFYADHLLEVNGVILVDDIRHKGVSHFIDYVTRNYRHYELVRRTPASATMATFVKLREDDRDWNFHKNF